MVPAPTRLVAARAGLDRVLAQAAGVIREGGIVIFPTGSFYGLAANPRDDDAIARLAAVKGREADKPIALIAASIADVHAIGDLPPAAVRLANRLWPGSLTMAIEPRGRWPARILGNTGTVGVRIPGSEIARRLAGSAGGLLTATSANLAGRPPPASPDQLDPDLVAKTQLIVDAGRCAGGEPSTVVTFEGGRVTVVREGAVPLEALRAVVGDRVWRPRG